MQPVEQKTFLENVDGVPSEEKSPVLSPPLENELLFFPPSVPILDPPQISEIDTEHPSRKRKIMGDDPHNLEPPKKRKKRSRRKKDPNAPKRPQTPYLLFYSDHVREYISLEEFKNKNGNVDMTLVSKDIGRRWKELNFQIKQRYKTEYENRKVAYEEELRQYREVHGESDKEDVKEEEYEINEKMTYEELVGEIRKVTRERNMLRSNVEYLEKGFLKFSGTIVSLHHQLDNLVRYL